MFFNGSFFGLSRAILEPSLRDTSEAHRKRKGEEAQIIETPTVFESFRFLAGRPWEVPLAVGAVLELWWGTVEAC
eukprot:9468650-Pyramimonas_sp.AAC.1